MYSIRNMIVDCSNDLKLINPDIPERYTDSSLKWIIAGIMTNRGLDNLKPTIAG